MNLSLWEIGCAGNDSHVVPPIGPKFCSLMHPICRSVGFRWVIFCKKQNFHIVKISDRCRNGPPRLDQCPPVQKMGVIYYIFLRYSPHIFSRAATPSSLNPYTSDVMIKHRTNFRHHSWSAAIHLNLYNPEAFAFYFGFMFSGSCRDDDFPSAFPARTGQWAAVRQIFTSRIDFARSARPRRCARPRPSPRDAIPGITGRRYRTHRSDEPPWSAPTDRRKCRKKKAA